jgi:plastocyanin
VHRLLLVSLSLAAAMAVAACGGSATSPYGRTGAPAATGTPAPASAGAPSLPPASVPPAGTGEAVTIANFAFSPATLTVKVGTTVTWTNTDSATHTVAWADGSPGSGSLTVGGPAYTRTFDSPGTFAYACGIHAAMKGTVVVEP